MLRNLASGSHCATRSQNDPLISDSVCHVGHVQPIASHPSTIGLTQHAPGTHAVATCVTTNTHHASSVRAGRTCRNEDENTLPQWARGPNCDKAAYKDEKYIVQTPTPTRQVSQSRNKRSSSINANTENKLLYEALEAIASRHVSVPTSRAGSAFCTQQTHHRDTQNAK